MFIDYSGVNDEEIKDYYTFCNGNPERARSHFQIGIKRILRVWSEYDLEPKNIERKRGGPRVYYGKNNITEKDKIIIIKRYNMYNGSPSKAAESLSYRKDIIKEIWLEAGLSIRLGRYDIHVPSLVDKV